MNKLLLLFLGGLLVAGAAQAWIKADYGYVVLDSNEVHPDAPSTAWNSIVGQPGTFALPAIDNTNKFAAVALPATFDFEFGMLDNIAGYNPSLCYETIDTDKVFVHLYGFINFRELDNCPASPLNMDASYFMLVEDAGACDRGNPSNAVHAWVDKHTIGPVYYQFQPGPKLVIEVTGADLTDATGLPAHPGLPSSWQYILHGGGVLAHTIDVIYNQAFVNEDSTVGDSAAKLNPEAGIEMDVLVWDAVANEYRVRPEGCIGVHRSETGQIQAPGDYAVRYMRLRPPVAADSTFSVWEDSPLTAPSTLLTPGVVEPNGFTYELQLVAEPQWGALYSATGTPFLPGSPVPGPDIHYVPDPDYHGSDAFQFVAVSDGGFSARATITVEVKPINDAPRGPVGPDLFVPHSGPVYTDPLWAPGGFTVGPAFEALDGQAWLQFSAEPSPPELFVAGPTVADSGAISFQTRPGCGGEAEIALTLRDDGGTGGHPLDDDLSNFIFYINIATTPNLPPQMVAGQMVALEGLATVIPEGALDSSDAESDAWTMTFTLTRAPEHGYLADRDGPVELGDTFTQRQLDLGQVVYVHKGEGLVDSFQTSIADCMGLSAPPADVRVVVVDPLSFATVDQDRDGIADGDDNCPAVQNRRQADHDFDGIGDACDPDFLALAAENEDLILTLEARDRDNDRVPDLRDNCPRIANPFQADQDLDQVGEACDPDLDGDEIAQERGGVPLDNCPLIPNGNQRDTDGDGVGDVCDADPMRVDRVAPPQEECTGIACGASGAPRPSNRGPLVAFAVLAVGGAAVVAVGRRMRR